MFENLEGLQQPHTTKRRTDPCFSTRPGGLAKYSLYLSRSLSPFRSTGIVEVMKPSEKPTLPPSTPSQGPVSSTAFEKTALPSSLCAVIKRWYAGSFPTWAMFGELFRLSDEFLTDECTVLEVASQAQGFFFHDEASVDRLPISEISSSYIRSVHSRRNVNPASKLIAWPTNAPTRERGSRGRDVGAGSETLQMSAFGSAEALSMQTCLLVDKKAAHYFQGSGT